jgi:hypothetical protein
MLESLADAISPVAHFIPQSNVMKRLWKMELIHYISSYGSEQSIQVAAVGSYFFFSSMF